MTCTTSEDRSSWASAMSDQSLYCPHEANSEWDWAESSVGAQVILLVWSSGGSNGFADSVCSFVKSLPMGQLGYPDRDTNYRDGRIDCTWTLISPYANILNLKQIYVTQLDIPAREDCRLDFLQVLSEQSDEKNCPEPPYDKTNKMACAPSEDSDQTGHPPSLIRVFAFRMKKAWVLRYPLSAQRRLLSDWAYAQADLTLWGVHMPFCWFCHESAPFTDEQ